MQKSQRSISYGPAPVDDPVYNVLEDPYAESSERPAWYGSTNVDGPVYNALEKPYQYASPPCKVDPVYNILEAPDYSRAGEADSYGSTGIQDPVYNVLESPNHDESSGDDGLYSNSLESQNPGVRNNIPVYAVINKKKK